MKPRLLFPTDFSDTAHTALDFALKMIEKAGGELIFFHAYHLPALDNSMDAAMLERMEEDTRRQAYDRLLQYAQETAERYQQRTGSSLAYIVDVNPGYAIETLPEAVYRHQVQFVVMGTKGASGLEQTLLGSNAADAIEKVTAPLLIVPEGGRYHAIKRIVYAVDCSTEDVDHMQPLLQFARLFDGQIHFVHVHKEGDDKELNAYRQHIEPLLEGYKVHFEVLKGNSTEDAILQYGENKQADVLALFHRDRHFLSRLFHRSLTKKMAFHSKIPLLAFRDWRRE